MTERSRELISETITEVEVAKYCAIAYGSTATGLRPGVVLDAMCSVDFNGFSLRLLRDVKSHDYTCLIFNTVLKKSV